MTSKEKLAEKQAKFHITSRQFEVLTLVCNGLGNKEIGRKLGISPGTVKSHMRTILSELGTSNRLQTVIFVNKHKILSHPPKTRSKRAKVES